MNELLRLVPRLKRARGYRLYDYNGNTYLDFFQNGGRALLGHRSSRLSTVLKDVISKGILTDLPSVYERRLVKGIRALIPGYKSIRIGASLERALEFASLHLDREVKEEDVCDPALQPEGGAEAAVAYWRPLLPASLQGPKPEVLIPIIPFAMGGAPEAICFKSPLSPGFPESDTITPVILAGAVRALFNLKNYRPPDWFKDDFFKDAAGWRQRRIYLVPECSPELYRVLFERYLEAGVLISPSYPGPSIIPSELSPGEIKKTVNLFKQYTVG